MSTSGSQKDGVRFTGCLLPSPDAASWPRSLTPCVGQAKLNAARDSLFVRDHMEGELMTREDVLKKVKSGEITIEDADRLLAELEQPKRGVLYCKVSQKGGISVYGLQRMPVTLYVEQWNRLLTFGDEIRKFAKEHDSELKRKGDSRRSADDGM